MQSQAASTAASRDKDVLLAIYYVPPQRKGFLSLVSKLVNQISPKLILRCQIWKLVAVYLCAHQCTGLESASHCRIQKYCMMKWCACVFIQIFVISFYVRQQQFSILTLKSIVLQRRCLQCVINLCVFRESDQYGARTSWSVPNLVKKFQSICHQFYWFSACTLSRSLYVCKRNPIIQLWQ